MIKWINYCIPCGSWCCYGENIFASADELIQLRVDKIIQKDDGSCMFLSNEGTCSVYEKRPFECKIFPFDIEEIGGDFYWTIWDICPAHLKFNHEEHLQNLEKTVINETTKEYIRQYLSFHSSNQPKKYKEGKTTLVRKINFPENNP